MPTCTFFGHRDCPDSVFEELKKTIMDLIEKRGVKTFLVGNSGNFDALVRRSLKELKKEYDFEYFVVIPRVLSNAENEYYKEKGEILLLPDGFEKVPPKFCIDYRNKYMLNKAEYVVSYVTHPFGGAAKFTEMAEKQNKAVINIASPANP